MAEGTPGDRLDADSKWDYIFNHVFLPPRLPQEDDNKPDRELYLLEVTVDSLSEFQKTLESPYEHTIESVHSAIIAIQKILSPNATLDKATLENELSRLCCQDSTASRSIPLYVKAQNCGILVTKSHDSVILEAFELLALNQDVITTKGRLKRSFPGPAISIEIEAFRDGNLQDQFAAALQLMSAEQGPNTLPQAYKAGKERDETRNTPSPRLVTELLFGFLQPMASPIDTPRLWKNSREDVLHRNAFGAWHRSPIWMLLRVIMQLLFSRSKQPRLYKSFMVFHMARVLSLCHTTIPKPSLYMMNCKLVRRLSKLRPLDREGNTEAQHDPTIPLVHEIISKTTEIIEEWQKRIVREREKPIDLEPLSRLQFRPDAVHKLPLLDAHIEAISNRTESNVCASKDPTGALVTYCPTDLPSPNFNHDPAYKFYNFRAFESWVESSLDGWIHGQDLARDSVTTTKLGELMTSYYGAAHSDYSTSPETFSVMVLTTLELWVAADKSATALFPLLKEYDPEVKTGQLQLLVLPLKCQMERLYRSVAYIEERRRSSHISMSRDFGAPNSFAVRYFRQSLALQSKLEDIETKAKEKRNQKWAELDRKRAEHEKLEREANIMKHSEAESRNGYIYHPNWCSKCRKEARAAAMDIDIHEWPLPEDGMQAEATVFELFIPPAFGHWRDSTMFLRSDILGFKYKESAQLSQIYTLDTDDQLPVDHLSSLRQQRIGVISETKPFLRTHYKKPKVSTATKETVCEPCGKKNRYYDNDKECFVTEQEATDHVSSFCTYQMPALSSSLQKYLVRETVEEQGTSETPNAVIADQSNCPAHMTLEEFKDLMTIPLGYAIQYTNILVQLALPAIDFKKLETSWVILQCIHQVGPGGSMRAVGEGHNILEDTTFGHALLDELASVTERVRENWESAQVVSTMVSLATRLLSLCLDEEVAERCVEYLASAREIALAWATLLKRKAQESTPAEERLGFVSGVVEAALVCLDTFNVSENYLQRILDSRATSIFIQCAIATQEGDYTLSGMTDPRVLRLHRCWQRTCHRAHRLLAATATIRVNGTSPLDEAVLNSWSAYRIGDEWKPVSDTVDYWLVSTTKAEFAGGRTHRVHINLLTGELLVQGSPLSRLPSRYEEHPHYRLLFGSAAIECLPGTATGMEFSSKKMFAGFDLQFGLPKAGPGSDLIVQASRGGELYEFIPPRIIAGTDCFPLAFVDTYAHWYNTVDGTVQFCAMPHHWPTCPSETSETWVLTRAGLTLGWYLKSDGELLISRLSNTSREIFNVLSPLTLEDRIYSTIKETTATPPALNIELPCLQLRFNLEAGSQEMTSRQFRGMSVATSRTLGTLVGLENKLLLTSKKDGGRVLIIPDGNVSFERDGYHVSVRVDLSRSRRVHPYEIDEDLGRLVDNGSLQSKLTVCYLHALSSLCLPDSFTRNTGTEQALSILSSAAVRSFHRLDVGDVFLLRKIAKLTPSRVYYPPNMKEMQQVRWVPQLNCLSQHSRFFLLVNDIFAQDERVKIFHPDYVLDKGDLHKQVVLGLLERDMVRTSMFRVSGFGGEDYDSFKVDSHYGGRHWNQGSTASQRVVEISAFIYRPGSNLTSPFSPGLLDELWRFLTPPRTVDLRGVKPPCVINGPDNPVDPMDLSYGTKLLSGYSDSLASGWLSMFRFLSNDATKPDKFSVMIWFATLAFAEDVDIVALRALASSYVVSAIAHLQAPRELRFDLNCGYSFDEQETVKLVTDSFRPLAECPEKNMLQRAYESERDFVERRLREYEANQLTSRRTIVETLKRQWPCREPIFTGPFTHVDESFMATVRDRLKTWHRNFLLRKHLLQVSTILRSQSSSPVDVQTYPSTAPAWEPQSRRGLVSVSDLFYLQAPTLHDPSSAEDMRCLLTRLSTGDSSTPFRLRDLIAQVRTLLHMEYRNNYVKELEASLQSLQDSESEPQLKDFGDRCPTLVLEKHLAVCRDTVSEAYTSLVQAVTPTLSNKETVVSSLSSTMSPEGAIAASNSRHLPRISPVLFLQMLTREYWSTLTQDWKNAVVAYAKSITQFHRAQRMLAACGSPGALAREIRNVGHTNWDPLEYPESLLVEVENGITIREIQEQVAGEMRNPSSGGDNAVMQLNMGEGKSSVIVPIVAAALADTSRLVRVVVAKPQSRQMFHMLASKLGGLLNRRIYHMPFSRDVRLSTEQSGLIKDMCQECMEGGGVLLVQPEHILSFRLMGLECLLVDKQEVGKALLQGQHFFNRYARDIVDESDENFSVKFELIYTMGLQESMEFSPDRWILIQEILNKVKQVAPSIQDQLPNEIEIGEIRAGAFARTRFLTEEAQHRAVKAVASTLFETGFRGFPIGRQPQHIREAVFTYVTKADLSSAEISAVEITGDDSFWTDATKSTLLLLRGLLANGILNFAFGQKRWRVNYGLDLRRTNLAVPYRAKDNPAPRAEFSHPDVVIVLTCLSYYYGGLTDDNLFDTFGVLLRSDQADAEYQMWVDGTDGLPIAFVNLMGISLKDRSQCINKVFPYFRHNKRTTDFYLSKLVFPKEMKVFPSKLSASGWDIGEKKCHPTTGFSGTNDSKKMLPLDVRHLDLDDQRHTNALVLENLLRDENTVELMEAQNTTAADSDAEILLDKVVSLNPPTRVILDVGAQILELNNLGVASAWLCKVQDGKTQAVVFFNDHDEICVYDRKGHIESFHTSPFSKNPEKCLIFLDEAHTRGTDLKLPSNYRAAVTLGANLTKDKLVQACMRMRQLGKGQSVVFCVPVEIQTKILTVLDEAREHEITVLDILTWAISETCLDICRSIPLWATQGERYIRHRDIWRKTKSKGGINMDSIQAEGFLDPEAQSIESRYRPSSTTAKRNSDLAPLSTPEAPSHVSADIQRIKEVCAEFKTLNFCATTLHEEQERELSPEVEAEREVQRPPQAKPAPHSIHPDIIKFARTGHLRPFKDRASSAYMPAFQSLQHTSAASYLNVTQFPTDILVTADFATTIEDRNVPKNSMTKLDDYCRPVRWILTSSFGVTRSSATTTSTTAATRKTLTARKVLIISPYEANTLLPILKANASSNGNSKRLVPITTLHCYSPRPNLAFPALDHLSLYTTPPLDPGTIFKTPLPLRVQLNLFAGQLYMSSYIEYVAVCDMLGLASESQSTTATSTTMTLPLRTLPRPLRTRPLPVRTRPLPVRTLHLPTPNSTIPESSTSNPAPKTTSDSSTNHQVKMSPPSTLAVALAADGFILPPHNRSTFTTSPVKFMIVLMSKIRRSCVGVEMTHMGRLLDGGVLVEKEFAGTEDHDHDGGNDGENENEEDDGDHDQDEDGDDSYEENGDAKDGDEGKDGYDDGDEREKQKRRQETPEEKTKREEEKKEEKNSRKKQRQKERKENEARKGGAGEPRLRSWGPGSWGRETWGKMREPERL